MFANLRYNVRKVSIFDRKKRDKGSQSMTNVPRLCGGTFLLQVLRMKKPATRKPSKALDGEKDKVNNQRVLEALIQLFDPTFVVYSDGTFKGDTSDYRACKEATGSNLPFTEKYADFSTFDNIVKSDYMKILPRMKRFTNTFVHTDNPKKVNSSVRALLSCIDKDETILPEDKFYMGEMGHPITKADLLKKDNISLDSFLLGLWHFILMNRQNNRVGRDTFEDWCDEPEGPGKQWKYSSKIGSDYHDISIHRTGDDCIINKTEETVNEEEILDEDEQPYETDTSDDPGLLDYRKYFVQISQTVNYYNNYGNGTIIANVQGDLIIGANK